MSETVTQSDTKTFLKDAFGQESTSSTESWLNANEENVQELIFTIKMKYSETSKYFFHLIQHRYSHMTFRKENVK